MITKINQRRDCRATIHYLEKKVEQGDACFHGAVNSASFEGGINFWLILESMYWSVTRV